VVRQRDASLISAEIITVLVQISEYPDLYCHLRTPAIFKTCHPGESKLLPAEAAVEHKCYIILGEFSAARCGVYLKCRYRLRILRSV